MLAVADTHAVIWYLANDSRLSAKALTVFANALIARQRIGVSAISLVEMVYLIEKGKVPAQRFTELVNRLNTSDSVLMQIPVDQAVARAMTRVDVLQIPDMPDRIIAATAAHLNVPIISRDGRIALSSLETIW